MPGRGNEVIRQWTILRALASNRRTTIDVLADELGASTRTVRRDLDALQAAGFPIEEHEDEEGKCWRLPPKAMARLERNGLTFGELASLYLSRALFECFAESALLSDLQSALDKVDAALSPATRKFLDRLPQAISAKSPKVKRQERATHGITLRLLEAILGARVVTMRYDSRRSRRLKSYVVHPYRVVHADGGLYLIAYVPEYAELRTFAVERIRQAAADKVTFEPIEELGSDPFANSIGAFRAQPVKVQLRFTAAIAERVKERNWHHSQQFRDRSDGSVVMTLQVSDDLALRGWILSFGSGVRVLAPASLAEWMVAELDTSRAEYGDDAVANRSDSGAQPGLPFYQYIGQSE
ncbi:MAG: transcriptional regulator [Vicinamibacterales bacterium]